MRDFAPDVVMTGHAGSTPAHASCLRVMQIARQVDARILTVYGGVYPTYHGEDILHDHACVDIVVRGEGEAVALALVQALQTQVTSGAHDSDWRHAVRDVAGIGYRGTAEAPDAAPLVRNPDAPLMRQLDDWRVAWELIADWDVYQCFGVGRAAVYQFSRGCPHQCSYCGQYQFWEKWRYRSPQKAAKEIADLYHRFGVRFVDLADENPTSSRRLWREFLEALVHENVPVKLFATIRATDIVRDADLLDLARRAGLVCVLMGIETTDAQTLAAIRKGSTTAEDREAVRLLRRHGILSMLGHIVGFAEERRADYRQATRQIALYDPDLLNAMYVTPHRWSDWGAEHGDRLVVQPDPVKWDYRHQLLGSRHLRPWQVFALVKWMELRIHLRPRALWRILRHPDADLRRYLRWCFVFSARVWLYEVAEFLRRPTRAPRAGVPAVRLRDWFRPRRAAVAPVTVVRRSR
jgi:anaerobic magnesium-protoporphyrin IX monomethyl ester cyclase